MGTAATVLGAGLTRAEAGAKLPTPGPNPTDLVYDVVIVGAGAAGFSAAHGVLREDPNASVVILEARPTYGGTSYRSGGRLWICNNADLRSGGLSDPRDKAIAYMAKLSHPDAYKPEAHRYGLTERQYAQLAAYYDNGASMLDYYRDTKIMPWHAETGVFLPGTADPLKLTGKFAPDYHPEFVENVPKGGRSIMPEFFDPSGATASSAGRMTAVGDFGSSIYGPDVIEWLNLGFRERGGEVHLGTRVVDLVTTRTSGKEDDDAGFAVTGVRAHTVLDGGTVVSEPAPYAELPVERTYYARRGVIFTAGGFSKSTPKVASNFTGDNALTGGGCAVVSAVGDLTDLGRKYNLKIENMDQAWFVENIYEQYKLDPNSALSPNYLLFQAYWLAGDSMFVVNRRGQRVTNEKQNYNDRTKAHFSPDNRFLFSVFDKHSFDNFVGLGGQIIPDPAVLIGPYNTLPELVAGIETRLQKYPDTAAFGLASDFASGLARTLDTFNGYAKTGKDLDFKRGESAIDVWWHAFCLAFHGGVGTKDCISANVDASGNPYPNVTMRPLEAPYYAVLLSSGLQDTKGGPAIDELGRILNEDEEPVPGLYGAGNCIASPAGAGYWGAGGTLGPATVFGHIAGRHAAKRRA
jgi:glycine/D-amino acid oxidase-like deaminating enzyme